MKKCCNHPYISAIGACVICNKDLCEFCAYIINGKIYCKLHANEILSKKAAPIKINIPKITAILFFMQGILIFITIFFFIMEILGVEYALFSIFILLITAFISPYNILGLLAGYWIWERKRKGIALGVSIAILGFLNALGLIRIFEALSILYPIELKIVGSAFKGLAIFYIFLIILLIACWREFKKEREKIKQAIISNK